MRNVLILTHSFPEEVSAGSLRPYSWYKHFHQFGIKPIVITKNWSKEKGIKQSEVTQDENGTIIQLHIPENKRDRLLSKYGENKFVFFRRLLTLFYAIFSFVSFRWDKMSVIYDEAEKYIKNNQVDCILVTGEPFVLFRYGYLLSKSFNVPWIADYRDGWSTNYAIHSASFLEKFLMRFYFKPLEKKYIKRAQLITTVSKPIQSELQELHNKKVALILNGYDKSQFKAVQEQSKEKLVIAYAGSILSYQRIDIFMRGFEQFIGETNANCELIFYGLNELLCQTKKPHEFLSTEIAPKVTYTNAMRPSEVFQELGKANLLLVLSNESIDGSCSKIYEYLALNRKIIVSVDDSGTLNELIHKTDAGVLCKTTEDVCGVLRTSYKELLKHGYVASTTQNIEQYSREEQAKELAKLVQEVVR